MPPRILNHSGADPYRVNRDIRAAIFCYLSDLGVLGPMELLAIVNDIADAIFEIDRSATAFKEFRPGVGPYGEPQLVRLIRDAFNEKPSYARCVVTKRTPDMLVPGKWALEFKIARPFGDNGKVAENWSVNLLHPYPGNVSALADCLKLREWQGAERRAEIVIGYEHSPAQIPLDPLIDAFEAIARQVLVIPLGPRVALQRNGLIHPVHQCLKVFAWEVLR